MDNSFEKYSEESLSKTFVSYNELKEDLERTINNNSISLWVENIDLLSKKIMTNDLNEAIKKLQEVNMQIDRITNRVWFILAYKK